MRSYDPVRDRAEELLERLTRLLDEELLQQRIDEPIDDALAAFKCPQPEEPAQAQFHQAISEFLTHVRAYRKEPPLWDALGEAMALIEAGYCGTHSDGYDGALDDATNPSYSGIEMVLARMAETIKALCREKYIRWIIARNVTLAEWETQCALTALLVAMGKEWLSPELQRCAAEQLVGCIPELLNLHLDMKRVAQAGPVELFAGRT